MAYIPPSNSSISFEISSGYVPPSNSSISFSLGGSTTSEEVLDIPLDIQVRRYSSLDFSLDISSYYQEVVDVKLDIESTAISMQDFPLDLSLALESSDTNLLLDILLTKQYLSDIYLDIFLVDGFALDDFYLDISIGNGNSLMDLSLDIMAITQTQTFKAVYGMQLNSIMEDVT